MKSAFSICLVFTFFFGSFACSSSNGGQPEGEVDVQLDTAQPDLGEPDQQLADAPAQAEYAHPEAIVSTEWLSQHLADEDLKIIHMTTKNDPTFEEAHIPGALLVGWLTDMSEPSAPVLVTMLYPESFEALMAKLGVNNDTTVVVYDSEGGTWGAKLWWGLRFYGHDKVGLLNGGLKKWQSEGRDIETGPSPYPSDGTFKATKRPELLAVLEDVKAAIDDPEVFIIDTLPEEDYLAEHIPTAINMPTPNNQAEDLTLLPPEELEQLWSPVGLKPESEIITYCGGGYYGSFGFFALYQLGYEHVRLYDGSMMEWNSHPELPVNTGPEP